MEQLLMTLVQVIGQNDIQGRYFVKFGSLYPQDKRASGFRYSKRLWDKWDKAGIMCSLYLVQRS